MRTCKLFSNLTVTWYYYHDSFTQYEVYNNINLNPLKKSFTFSYRPNLNVMFLIVNTPIQPVHMISKNA